MNHIKLSNELLNDTLELVFEGMLKVPLYKKYPPSKSGIKKMLKGYIHGALKCGVFDYHYEGDQLVAIFIFTKTDFASGLPITIGTIDCNGSKSSLRWIKAKLLEYQILFNEKSHLELPIHLKRLLPFFELIGFSVDTVKLLGVSKECLKKFKGHGKSHLRLDELHLSLSRARKSDLMSVMDIERREFKRNPQFGWFVANENWLKTRYKARVNALKNEKSTSYVLKNKRGRVVGFFGSEAIETPNLGNLGTPEFLFDQSIQGQGLSKIGYQILLEDMTTNGIKYFMGNTAQLGVFKNAKKMGRAPINFFLRYTEGYFKTDYFLENI